MVEMPAILAKEENDIKKGMVIIVSTMINPNSASQKRNTLPKNTNDNRTFNKKNMGAKKNR